MDKNKEHYTEAKQTYEFLRRALGQPAEEYPIRGPRIYDEDEGARIYWFDFEGSLEDGSWEEIILFGHEEFFKQRGESGLIIDKDENRNPVFPWDL